MAGNEVSLVNQIGRLNRRMPKAKVRHRHAARLFGIIVKVCLGIHICIVTDDLDGVLVCSYGTVSAQPPELTVGSSLRRGNNRRSQLQGQMGNIINNTNGKWRLGRVLIYSNDLGRSGILGAQAITSS